MPLLFFIGAFMVLVMGLVTTQYAHLGGLGPMRSVQVDQEYVNQVGVKMRQWYTGHLMDMDGSPTPVFPGCPDNHTACVLKDIGIQARYGVLIRFQPRVYSTTSPIIASRKIDIWIPKADVRGTARQSFVSNRAFVDDIVSGGAIEQRALQFTQSRLQQIATLLQQGYSSILARYGDNQIDWFENPECPASGAFAINQQIGCPAGSQGWMTLAASNLGQLVNDDGPAANPWGLPYRICNNASCGADDQSAPYTAIIQTQTPWQLNHFISVYAIEPLNTAS